MEQSFTFRVPNDLKAVPDLRERLADRCRDAGLAEDELAHLRLIVDELLNNSIEHGCTHPDDSVEVTLAIMEDRVEVAVDDPGQGELSEESFPDGPNGVFNETGRGAGLILIKAFTDEIHVEANSSGGTRIRAVKYRHGGQK